MIDTVHIRCFDHDLLSHEIVLVVLSADGSLHAYASNPGTGMMERFRPIDKRYVARDH